MTFFDGGGGSQQIRDELGSDPDERPVVKIKSERVKIREGPTIVRERNIAGDTLIWGHTTFGEWDAYNWGDATNTSFVFGNLLASILGTSPLGSQLSTWDVRRVVNPNNTFIERFRNTQFEDSSETTADWDTTNFYVDFTAAEIAQTEEIFLNNENLLAAKPSLTIDSGSISIYLTPNGGDTTPLWYEFTNNTWSNFADLSIDLDQTLIGDEEVWLKMDEDAANTDVFDSSGNSVDGTASFNTADNTESGVIGTALSIPGTTDKIDLESSVLLTDAFSVSAWIKKSAFSTHGICGDQTAYNSGRLTFRTTTSFSLYTASGNSDITVSSAFPTDEWFHIVVTRDSSDNLKAYVNGTDVTSGSPSQAGNVNVNRVGDNPDDSGWTALAGTMDEFRLFSRVITAAEIAILYNDGTYVEGNDLRLRIVEDNSSTARVSEIKVEYTT